MTIKQTDKEWTERWDGKLQATEQRLEDFKNKNKEFSQINSGENRTISDSDARENLIESLDFENANTKHKKAVRFLNARSTLTYEWIKTTTDIESNPYNFQLWLKRQLQKGCELWMSNALAVKDQVIS